MFWRNISPLSSGTKNTPSKKPARKQVAKNLFFDPEDGDDFFLRNVG
jgi:hypothetical protein